MRYSPRSGEEKDMKNTGSEEDKREKTGGLCCMSPKSAVKGE